MEELEKITPKTKVNPIGVINQLTQDLDHVEKLLDKLIVIDGVPSELFSQLIVIDKELDQINEMTSLLRK